MQKPVDAVSEDDSSVLRLILSGSEKVFVVLLDCGANVKTGAFAGL